MANALMMFFVFLVLLVFKNYSNKLTWVLMLAFCSIAVLILTSVLYISRFFNYDTISGLDRYIFWIINNLKFNIFLICDIISVCVGCFLVSQWSFWVLYDEKKEQRYWFKIIILFFAIYYMVMNSSEVSKNIYIYTNDNPDKLYLQEIFYKSNRTIVCIFMVLPFVSIYNAWKNHRIKFLKLQCVCWAVCWGLIDLFFLGVFFEGPYKDIVFNKNLLKIINNPSRIGEFFLSLEILQFLLFAIVFIILMKSKLLIQSAGLRRRKIFKFAQILAKDLVPILHTNKNTFLSIEMLERLTSENYGTEKGKEYLESIRRISHDSVEKMKNLLNIFNNLSIKLDQISLSECIEVALERSIDNQAVKVYKNLDKSVTICGDKYHITEMFGNLFINSIEALKGRVDGYIKIEMIAEGEWVCILIEDNGGGINKKELKTIFRPLSSTKQSRHNWGIGLSYVYKVIYTHLGMISASTKNGTALFTILIPKERG